ncbi:MAG: PAS domain S-box protein [Pelatocladus maniniholoensis HA4357-MV3]|jgi:PAS domain S-box-containing protein|uniref:histidine kinase n=1 Tax=Pelatocladus maniniholoensis HA4357-MV3 TaxID=1117104 RepID=A0A9E3LQ03_9NOST|nr:PAS domain S-box protein [Pelatocladus maniniholoensis HA4357-MV3]
MHALTPVISLPSIDSVIDFSPLTVTPDTSLFDVVTLMNQQQTNCVLVTDEMRLLGCFTNQDVIRLVCCDFDFKTVQISQVMVTSVITIEYSQAKNIAYLLLFFRQNNLSLLPIVEQQNRLVGLITSKTISQSLQIVCYSLNQLTDTTEQLRQSQQIADSKQTWIETNKVPLHDSEGNVFSILGTFEDISDRLETQAALQKSEERFRFLAESIPQQVWIARSDGSVEYINQRIQNYLGCNQEGILDWKWQNWVHPEDLSKFFDAWQKSIFTGESLELEFRWRRVSDQTYRWHLSRAVPQRDQNGKILNWFATNTDIHDLKLAESELRQTQKRLQAILDNSPAIISVLDTQNRYLLINSEYEKVFQLTQEQVQDRSIYEIFPRDIADNFAVNNHNVFINGTAIEVEEIIPQDNGLHTYLSIKFTLKDDSDIPYAICSISTDITERKRTEQSLRLRDRAIAASSNGIVISDARLPNLPMIYANPAFEQITGYYPEDVIGRNCSFLQGIDTNQPEIQEIRNAIKQAKNCTVILRNYRRDGTLFWNELNISPVLDADGKCTHYVGIQNDITERKQAEMALLMSQQRLQHLLSATPAVIYTCKSDGDYEITFMSDNVTAMLDYEAWEFLEHSSFWSDRIHLEDKPYVFTEMANLLNQGECIREYRFLHKDGTYRWVYDQAKLVRDNTGSSVEIVGSWVDITKSKQLEQELRTALQKEKELNELKSRFISITSHEFRTPLTIILSSSELLEYYHHKWTEEKRLSHIRRIQTSVKHMTDMLNDVLVIGKAEAGRLDFKPISLDLVEYCRDLIQELQQDGDTEDETENAIAFHCEYESMHCRVDKNLLGHILRNLLTNAIKYSVNDGIIKFTLTEQKNQVVFEIKDQGIGIPEEDLPLLFDSFHRAANVGNIPGTGLGLSIVKKCIDLHQGKIFVDSKVGVGTTFTIILPLDNY